MRKKNKTFLLNLLVCFFSIFFSFILGESIISMIEEEKLPVYEMANWLNKGEYKISNDEKLGWESSKIYFSKNMIFTKTKEYNISRSNNKTRIIVLGDSITEGAFLEPNETFSYLLENEVTKNKYEVINLGVTGYNIFQYTETLKRKGIILKPDVVIIGFFINDFINTPIIYQTNTTYMIVNYFQGNILLDNSFSWFLFRHSRIYRRIYRILVEKTVFNDYSENQGLYHFLQFREPGYNNFLELKNICEANNLSLLVAILPEITKSEDYKFLSIHQEIIGFLENNNFSYIDFLPIYNENDINNLQIPELQDNIHPNKKGNRLIADNLNETLSEMLKK